MQLFLTLPALFHERSVQYILLVPETVVMQSSLVLPMSLDASEQSGNWNRIGQIRLHECMGLPL